MMNEVKTLSPDEIIALLGENVAKITIGNGYVLAEINRGPIVGIPCTLPVGRDGVLVDPAVPITDEQIDEVRNILHLPDNVYLLDLFPGYFDGTVFWVCRPDKPQTHTLMNLYFSPSDPPTPTNWGDFTEMLQQFLFRCAPVGNWYTPCTGDSTGQSQHLMRTPLKLQNFLDHNRGGSWLSQTARALCTWVAGRFAPRAYTGVAI